MYWSINDRNSAWYHMNIEGLNYITYISSLILILLIDNKYTVDSITEYTNPTIALLFDDDMKIETLFVIYWRFRQFLRLISCWRLWKRWTCCCWECGPNFQSELKGWLLKGFKKYYNFVENRTYVGNTKEKKQS